MRNGFAQNLSNQLNVVVEAPTKLVWAYADGKYVVASRSKNNPNMPNLKDKGRFVKFYPEGKKMKTDYKCDKCGNIMIPIQKEGVTGMVCPNCGFGFVTSYIDPMYEDQNVYEVYLSTGNTITNKNYFLIQSITGKNIQEIKQLFESSPFLLYKGHAVEVRELKNKLDESGVKYVIVPDFNYEF